MQRENGSMDLYMDLLALNTEQISHIRCTQYTLRVHYANLDFMRRERGSRVLQKKLKQRQSLDFQSDLSAPLTILSTREIHREEHLRVRQVLRIYGKREENASLSSPLPLTNGQYDEQSVTVKHGQNALEIEIDNTDINASQRGIIKQWTFSSSTLPTPLNVEFKKTLELLATFDSTTYSSVFRERVFIGYGVIRIDRDIRIPIEETILQLDQDQAAQSQPTLSVYQGICLHRILMDLCTRISNASPNKANTARKLNFSEERSLDLTPVNSSLHVKTIDSEQDHTKNHSSGKTKNGKCAASVGNEPTTSIRTESENSSQKEIRRKCTPEQYKDATTKTSYPTSTMSGTAIVTPKQALLDTISTSNFIRNELNDENVPNISYDTIKQDKVTNKITEINGISTSGRNNCSITGSTIQTLIHNTSEDPDALTSPYGTSSKSLTQLKTAIEGRSSERILGADSPSLSTAQSPVLSTANSPVLSTANSPVLSTAQSPVLRTADSPSLSTAQSPVLSTAQSPVLSTAQSPVLSTAQSPVLSTAQSPVLRTAQSPVLRTANSPVLSTAQSPVLRTANSPVLSTAQSPVLRTADSPSLSTAQSPVLSTANSPVLSTAQSPVLRTADSPSLSTAQSPVLRTADSLSLSTAQSPVLRTANSPVLSTAQSPVLNLSLSLARSVHGIPIVESIGKIKLFPPYNNNELIKSTLGRIQPLTSPDDLHANAITPHFPSSGSCNNMTSYDISNAFALEHTFSGSTNENNTAIPDDVSSETLKVRNRCP
uniref:Serine-rich adhesin for platelets n=1 Tax=Heterorhabditis bacteriophora TaxID=37862 RepID=A0A1I7XM21_HETBA